MGSMDTDNKKHTNRKPGRPEGSPNVRKAELVETQRIVADVPVDIRERFIARCYQMGISAAGRINQLIEIDLAAHAVAPNPDDIVKGR